MLCSSRREMTLCTLERVLQPVRLGKNNSNVALCPVGGGQVLQQHHQLLVKLSPKMAATQEDEQEEEET